MAVSAYLIVDGVTGPSTSMTGAIGILSFSVGASNTSTYGTGASGLEAKAGRAHLRDITVAKVLDKTSTTLSNTLLWGRSLECHHPLR